MNKKNILEYVERERKQYSAHPLQPGEPFRFLEPGRIVISREALDMAAMTSGMNAIQLARHLLQQHRLRRDNLIQPEGVN